MDAIIIIIGIFFTSTLSGFLGMGGGMILMALLSLMLPIQEAMIVHGFTQFFANGFRAFFHREHIEFKILIPYTFFSIFTLLFLRYFTFSPDKADVLLCLGIFPFVGLIPKLSRTFSIQRKFRAAICGVLVSCTQILGGASGGILDMFYISSNLNRFQILSNKAITQTLGHFLKLIYYYSLISVQDDLKLTFAVYPLFILTAFIATAFGKSILLKFKESQFRKYNKLFILFIACLITVKALRLKGII